VTIDTPTVESRLRLLESCVRGIVLEFDEAGRYLEVWTHDESLLVRPRRELLGSTINEVLGVAAGAPFMEMLRVIFAEQRPVRHDYQLQVLGGSRWFAAEGFPGRGGQTAVLLVQDITERKQMEAQLIESDRLAAIGLLAGGIGHEINNPLAWVMTHLRTVQAEVAALAHDGDPMLVRWSAQLSEAMQGSDRIRQIVRDLAFFTRSPENDSAPVDLRRTLDWAAEMAVSELRHRARLTKQYRDAPEVAAPEARLGQVFLNLLINAAQSIVEGDIGANEVRIELSTDENGRARVDIVDTGGGVAPQHLPRLFDPFFTTKPRGAGTGLGLSVSRQIVHSLSGSLEVVSAQAGHTCFRVTLPAALAGSAGAKPAAALASKLQRPMRVLVIDDQPSFLVSLRLAMRGLVELHEECSAREALARLRSAERFDAVLCDLMMPDLSGIDFHEHVFRDLPHMLPKIIYMTGGAFTERARQFLLAVPNPRIEKPFLPEQLEDLLARLPVSA
jgi:signal transduction histidine kinase